MRIHAQEIRIVSYDSIQEATLKKKKIQNYKPFLHEIIVMNVIPEVANHTLQDLRVPTWVVTLVIIPFTRRRDEFDNF